MTTHSVQHKLFNQGILDRKDPTEGIGTLLLPFSLYHVYDDVNKETIAQVCNDLYANVASKLQEGNFGDDIKFQMINFQDAKQRGVEGTRKYIVITRDTNRKTRITVLVRFLPYGNKLYVGVDSYILGSMNTWQVVWRILVTFLPLAFMAPAQLSLLLGSNTDFLAMALGAMGSLCCVLIPWWLVTVPILWLKVYRNFRQEKNLTLAMRQTYNRVVSGQSFNTDDILMTLKSILPLILYSIKDVFETNDIPVKTLDAFVETIKTVNNVQNVYGSYNAVAAQGSIATNTNSMDRL